MTKLATELKINSMTLKNKTFMAPISLGQESPDGAPSDAQVAYWCERAKGEVGCIILDATSVDPNTPYLGNTLYFSDEVNIEKHRKFVDLIHNYGTKVIPQITHPGPESISAFFGVAPKGPSNYLNSLYQQVRALTKEELPEIVEQYATASYKAKMVGYDGIELHAAHSYMLLGAFLSPLRNSREDEYGGSLMNRARLLIEVIDAIKLKCGKDFPIILRISGDEKIEGGNRIEDVKTLVPVLIKHGIDAFEISGGAQYELPNKIMPSHGEKQATNLKQAIAIKSVSSVPVILVGKINCPELARNLVDEDKVDGIVIGRSLLADPYFVKKTIEHKDDEIAPCAACLVGCVGEQGKRRPGSCVINPFLGKEATMMITKTETAKKVAIIGGGIGGMAAGRIAAMRGHDVTIYEKADRLGGQINLACLPPHKEDLKKWVDYFNRELDRFNITIELNHQVDTCEIEKMDTDIILVATGSTPITLSNQAKTCTAHEFLNGDVVIKKGNVLVVGGGSVGCETVETLNARKEGDLSITMIEMTSAIGAGMPDANLYPIRKRLSEINLTILTDTKLIELEENKAKVETKGEIQLIEGFTHVIFAVGSKANNALYESIKDCGKPVYIIGDANVPQQAIEAIRDGVNAALEI